MVKSAVVAVLESFFRLVWLPEVVAIFQLFTGTAPGDVRGCQIHQDLIPIHTDNGRLSCDDRGQHSNNTKCSPDGSIGKLPTHDSTSD